MVSNVTLMRCISDIHWKLGFETEAVGRGLCSCQISCKSD